MSIVRSDRRPDALASFGEAHANLRQALVACDAQQASLEDLEINLGLASTETIDTRDRMCVMHFPAGATEGHTLDLCEELECPSDADNELADLGNDLDADAAAR